ncbi:MAG: sulfatase-like hydrolase/transferase [Rhizobiaceae bacterium]
MRGTLGLVMSLLCRPVTVAGAFIIVMTGLYVLEKIPANMPFVGFIVIAISASVFLLSRKPYLAAYTGMATVSIIAISSAVKYRLKGFDLHVFDFTFTGEDPDAIRFLVEKYAYLIVPVFVLIFLAVIFLVVLGFWEKRGSTAWPVRLALLAASCLGIYVDYPLAPDEPRYFHYLGGFNASSFFVSTLDLQYALSQSQFAGLMQQVPPQPPYAGETDCGDMSNQPDIFIVLSESATNPENFPQLKVGDLFKHAFLSQDGKFHPMYVETFGGGTWVSNLSVMSGLSTADFGVQAPYVTTVLEGKVHGALPEVLAGCGYRTVEITPVNHNFVNEGPFMESIGFQNVLDSKDIHATLYAHRDEFYFKAAEAFIEEHHRKGGGPLLLSLKTMFPHSPYNEPLVSENKLPFVKFGGDAATDEYMNRMLTGQHDFQRYLEAIRSMTTERGSVVLEYGDHQSYITKNLVDEQFGGNSLQDLRSIAYKTYFTVHSFNYDVDMKAFGDGPLDVGFLGAALIEGAHLPLSPMYRELIALKDLCQGRFHDCKDRAAVDRHLRRRVDSGLLDVLPAPAAPVIASATAGTVGIDKARLRQ